MRKSTFLALLTISVLFTSFIYECGEYYYFSKGATFEFILYSSKNKVDRVNTYTVNNVETTASSSKAMISFKGVDSKGKDALSGEFDIICDHDKFEVDAKNFIVDQQANTYQDYTFRLVSKTNPEYPTNLSVGQKLNDAEIKLNIVAKDGSYFGSMECSITNRSVIGKDTVNVPAGSFTAYQVSADVTSKVVIAGLSIPVNVKQTDFFVPKFGIVKTIVYNKAGDKVRSTQVLSKYSKK